MIIDEEDYIKHFGVKGMHWGTRNVRTEGVSRSVDRHARKDAEEYARAKAFYGKGAGTRRKLIQQVVEGKSKNMPGYSKAFNNHLANQDPSKHAEKAISERTSIDRKEKTRQSAGAVARRITGEPGTQAAFVASAIAGAAYLNSPNGRAKLTKAAKTLGNIVDATQRNIGARHINKIINLGL